MTTPLTPDYLTGLSEMAYGPFDIGTANELIRALAAEVLRLRCPHIWQSGATIRGLDWRCRFCKAVAISTVDLPLGPCPQHPDYPKETQS